jgi:predicted O-methyltransferase YrrM
LVEQDYFDIIYIDADHKASSVLEDAILAFPLLKPGGVMIFDDYSLIHVNHTPRDIDFPKIGIDSFCHIFMDEIEEILVTYQLAILKKS